MPLVLELDWKPSVNRKKAPTLFDKKTSRQVVSLVFLWVLSITTHKFLFQKHLLPPPKGMFPILSLHLCYFIPCPPCWHTFLDLPDLGKSSLRPTSRLLHMRPSFPNFYVPAREAPDKKPCWLWAKTVGERSNGRPLRRL